jgi:hypothetical protein
VHRLRALVALALTIALLWAPAAMAEARRALVIGIDRYDALPHLAKAVNDARAVAGTLQGLGFDVLLAENPDRRSFNQRLNDFLNAIRPGDEAVFFFAGHGVEIEGRNYLLPADVPAALAGQEAFVTAESIAVDRVLDSIRSRGTRVTMLILDACRDNPFPTPPGRSAVPLGGSRGLGAMTAPEGAFILYSAGIGQQALDALNTADADPNSVFTRRLLPLMREPGLSAPQLARRLRVDVQALAQTVAHDQRPAYYDDLTGEFAFVPAAATAAPQPATGLPPVISPSQPPAAAPAPAPAPAPSAAPAAQPAPFGLPGSALPGTCQGLWVERNAIFKAFGYCFQSDRARSYFGNDGCFTDKPRLTPAAQARVDEIRALEKALGCG